MITNLSTLMIDAKKRHYAVPHFNCNNPDWIRVVLKVAQQLKSPVIIAGVSEQVFLTANNYQAWVKLIKNLIKELNITVPVVPHLDHGSYEECLKALVSGVPSVMFDGSSLPFAENLAKSKILSQIATVVNASLEVEVGAIGGEETNSWTTGSIANIDECQQMSKLKIDLLAAGIGNIHGDYPPTWKSLAFDVLTQINQVTNELGLSLHGGSGIPEEQIKKAITLGVTKINVHTEVYKAFIKGLTKSFEQNIFQNTKVPKQLFVPGYEAMEKMIAQKIKLFNSNNKAN